MPPSQSASAVAVPGAAAPELPPGGTGLRILMLAPHPFFQHRGTPIAVRALLGVLPQRGHRIDVLTYHEGEDIEIPGCSFHRIRAPFAVQNVPPGFSTKKLVCDAVMLRHAWTLIRENRYDLIHALEEASFMALLAKRLRDIPYVYDMDSSLTEQLLQSHRLFRPVKPLLEAMERWAIRESFAVLAVCKVLEEAARRLAPAKIVARIEDASLLGEELTEGELLTETIERPGPKVMYVGNLAPYQGIDLLLETFRHAVDSVPDAQLVVVGGSSEDIQRYQQRARELGIGDHAHFVGPRPLARLGWYLRQAEVLVSPRISGTNTPMKIYSYLDSGRAVLATRLPTHTQVLDDEISLLAEPTPEIMGSALARLLREKAMRERLGCRARARIQDEYSQKAYERKVHAFYARIEDALLDLQRIRNPCLGEAAIGPT